MMSDSAHDANNLRRRRRHDFQAYDLPTPDIYDAGSTAPQIRICDRYGDPPLAPVLIPFARALISLDLELLRRVLKYHQKLTSSEEEVRKAKATRFVKECIEITLQWKDINSGKCQFNQLYMNSNQLIPIWTEGVRIIKETLGNPRISNDQSQRRRSFEKVLDDCETLANKLQTQMVAAAHQGRLGSEVLYSIQERWNRLDETLDWYYNLRNRDADEPEQRMFRSSPAWEDVRRIVQPDDTRTRSDENLIRIQPAGSVRNETGPGTMIGPSEDKKVGALIFWLASFSGAVISTPLFALGYSRSPHLRGTVNDPDFWFLIQTTSMQILGLIMCALVERKRDSLTKWRWYLPTAIAGACALGAIPLYLVAPTEWSSFLSAVTGATQTFMTLQYFLF